MVLAMMVAISAHSARAGITEDYLTTDAVLGDLLDYNTSVSINFGDRTPVSKVLFGIFFEEVRLTNLNSRQVLCYSIFLA